VLREAPTRPEVATALADVRGDDPCAEHLATEVLEILLENDAARLATPRGELHQRLPEPGEAVDAAVELLIARGVARSRDASVQLT